MSNLDVVQFVTGTQNSIVANDPASTNKATVETNVTPAVMIAAFGAGNVRTANANFAIQVNGAIVQFRAGEVFVTNPALNTILSNNNCPVT
jgi:hypothetical protein